jgi:hypothetical protein
VRVVNARSVAVNECIQTADSVVYVLLINYHALYYIKIDEEFRPEVLDCLYAFVLGCLTCSTSKNRLKGSDTI